MRATRIPAVEQYRLIMEWRARCLTDYEWCLQHDIKPGTFYNWVKDIMWIWFAEISRTMGHSWLHWRRVLKFYEDYTLSGTIHPDGKYRYNPVMFDELPSWCREAVSGLLDQKRREFRDAGTIKSYRCSCTHFCRFLVDHGYESFNQFSPAVIKEFSSHDKHTTFIGRAGCFVSVRAFLRYLNEKGYTDEHGLDVCLMSGTAPQFIPPLKNY